ncbi:PREDICTED: uncharacterized protein LOC109241649 [Nicotiana attenuata]|uniref:uncharacterized protein LOC109241649 n=1 Tax=Nicotiana attenuata TaxID=49451 RepID=UPI00090558FA|nr:PREDICTED: uncharacterized protein LOC109241649 [Nicotiana attenuata]
MKSSNSSDIINPYSIYSSDDEDEEELEEIQREQDEKEWTALCQIAGKLILMYYKKYLCKEPCRTSSRSGNAFIQEILRGNETHCYENFRLRKSVFVDLSNDLTEKYGLKPTRGMSIHEMLGMFLMTCAHGAGNRLIQEIFQHSGETIHRHFHSVLKAICELARDIIRPHQNYNDGTGAHKPCNGRYLPFFRDCIGALDGTHVKARLPQGQEIPYIGRKGYPTQNILVVVDFNMCFTFAWAGWEGAAHDSRIFGEALRRPELNFPHPIGNKYYLVDAGYPHMKGYMAPYKGDNSAHLGFGKQDGLFLRDMPFYHIDTQRDIVLATMAIHNYIRKKCNMDDAFRAAENERYVPSVDPDVGTSLRANNNINAKNVEEQSDLVWMGLRDLIANEICEA